MKSKHGQVNKWHHQKQHGIGYSVSQGDSKDGFSFNEHVPIEHSHREHKYQVRKIDPANVHGSKHQRSVKKTKTSSKYFHGIFLQDPPENQFLSKSSGK